MSSTQVYKDISDALFSGKMIAWFVATCTTGALLSSVPRYEGLVAIWIAWRLLRGGTPLWGATTGGVLGVCVVLHAVKRRHWMLLVPLGAWGGDVAGAALWRARVVHLGRLFGSMLRLQLQKCERNSGQEDGHYLLWWERHGQAHTHSAQRLLLANWGGHFW